MLRVVEASLTGNETDQQQYLFLKKMVQILVELGSQLCAVWASKDTKMLQHAPDNFETYLQVRFLRFLAQLSDKSQKPSALRLHHQG